MVKHVVMWKVKDNYGSLGKVQILNEMKQILEELKDKIEQIKNLQVGFNMEKSYGDYDLVLICDFESYDDLEKYQEHEEHKKVSQFVSEVRISRACVDFEY